MKQYVDGVLVTLLGLLVFAVVVVGGPKLQDPGPPPEAYPGQSNHAEPPKDWFCAPPHPKIDQMPEHPCTCKRMQIHSPDDKCLENGDGTPYTMEDPKCLVFCHKDHCKCPTEACDT